MSTRIRDATITVDGERIPIEPNSIRFYETVVDGPSSPSPFVNSPPIRFGSFNDYRTNQQLARPARASGMRVQLPPEAGPPEFQADAHPTETEPLLRTEAGWEVVRRPSVQQAAEELDVRLREVGGVEGFVIPESEVERLCLRVAEIERAEITRHGEEMQRIREEEAAAVFGLDGEAQGRATYLFTEQGFRDVMEMARAQERVTSNLHVHRIDFNAAGEAVSHVEIRVGRNLYHYVVRGDLTEISDQQIGAPSIERLERCQSIFGFPVEEVTRERIEEDQRPHFNPTTGEHTASYRADQASQPKTSPHDFVNLLTDLDNYHNTEGRFEGQSAIFETERRFLSRVHSQRAHRIASGQSLSNEREDSIKLEPRGMGRPRQDFFGPVVREPVTLLCPACRGSGWITDEDRCSTCEGIEFHAMPGRADEDEMPGYVA